MNIYELLILKKLGLSEKFPRKILYMKKSALGIEIMKLLTMIVIIVVKLYLGYKKLGTKVGKIITINEQIQFFQSGYSIYLIETPRKYKIKNLT